MTVTHGTTRRELAAMVMRIIEACGMDEFVRDDVTMATILSGLATVLSLAMAGRVFTTTAGPQDPERPDRLAEVIAMTQAMIREATIENLAKMDAGQIVTVDEAGHA